MLTYVGYVLLMASAVGERIRHLRTRDGLSQGALGARIGVSRQTVSNWENGDTSPSVADLSAIAAVFAVREADLLADHTTSVRGYSGASGQNDARLGSAHGSAGARGTTSGYKIEPDSDLFNVVGRLDERSGVRALPIYRWGSMGDPRDHDAVLSPDREEFPPAGKESLVGPNGFGVDVRGDSMVGRGIHDRDVCWVNPDRPYRPGNVVLALITEDGGETGMVVKTFGRSDIGEGLISETATDKSPVICRQYKIIGPVVLVQRVFPP